MTTKVIYISGTDFEKELHAIKIPIMYEILLKFML